MPMTFDGNGTITGLAAGGLPDASITAAELSGAQSGSAPIYGARAWVNFNGTGTVAIRASGNVSSITDNGTGDYTVNFTTAMSDANYSTLATTNQNATGNATNISIGIPDNSGALLYSTTQVRLLAKFSTSSGFDATQVCVAILR
jgi:hypothetical protein